MVETKDDSQATNESVFRFTKTRTRGKMVEGSKRIRKRLLRTTTIYLHGQLSFVSSPMELDRDLDRRVEERRLNEETALESGGWSGGKKSKKASG